MYKKLRGVGDNKLAKMEVACRIYNFKIDQDHLYEINGAIQICKISSNRNNFDD